jgi:tRNA-uridine 2-sulfurtransferase
LLLEQGYEVTGIMLRLWKGEGELLENNCCTPDAISQAQTTARILGIPFYVLDARDEFKKMVVDYFIRNHLAGETPNPCVVCNQVIRWGFLRHRAKLMGTDHFATGHYARIDNCDGRSVLQRATDPAKDQSYVLARLTSEDLSKTIFPLGTWKKADVRNKAAELNLPVALKPDSQDLCFVGRDTVEFLKKYAPETEISGEIVDCNGNIVGRHKGLAYYTIGQRKGLKIGWSEPLYVVGKDINTNRLIVAPQDYVQIRKFMVCQTNWNIQTEINELNAEVMTRYRSRLFPAKITIQNAENTAVIETYKEIDIPTPGQLAVIYYQDRVLGSGFISKE